MEIMGQMVTLRIGAFLIASQICAVCGVKRTTHQLYLVHIYIGIDLEIPDLGIGLPHLELVCIHLEGEGRFRLFAELQHDLDVPVHGAGKGAAFYAHILISFGGLDVLELILGAAGQDGVVIIVDVVFSLLVVDIGIEGTDALEVVQLLPIQPAVHVQSIAVVIFVDLTDETVLGVAVHIVPFAALAGFRSIHGHEVLPALGIALVVVRLVGRPIAVRHVFTVEPNESALLQGIHRAQPDGFLDQAADESILFL